MLILSIHNSVWKSKQKKLFLKLTTTLSFQYESFLIFEILMTFLSFLFFSFCGEGGEGRREGTWSVKSDQLFTLIFLVKMICQVSLNGVLLLGMLILNQ